MGQPQIHSSVSQCAHWAAAPDSATPSAQIVLRSTASAVDSLVFSGDPVEVFTSVAEAALACGVVSATVELVDHESLMRVVRSADGDCGAPRPAHTPLSQTQALFLSNHGEPILDQDWLAVPISSGERLPCFSGAPGPDFLGALVCTYPLAPDELDVEVMQLLVRRAVSVVLQYRQEQALRERTANLEKALESNRQIGAAIGIVMATRLLSEEDGLQALRHVSQTQNRKLRDVAAEVVRIGSLAAG